MIPDFHGAELLFDWHGEFAFEGDAGNERRIAMLMLKLPPSGYPACGVTIKHASIGTKLAQIVVIETKHVMEHVFKSDDVMLRKPGTDHGFALH